MELRTQKKVEFGCLIFLSLISLIVIIFPMFYSSPYRPQHCKSQFESEANKVLMALSSYFSEPSRTQIPSIDDLVNLAGYILPENREIIGKDDNVKESDLLVFISDDADGDIVVEVTSIRGKCPQGKSYMLGMGWSEGKWIDSYEGN